MKTWNSAVGTWIWPNIVLVVLMLAVAVLAGCAYQPVVDQPGPAYAQDLAECRAHVEGVAGGGTGAAVGAGIGYVLGQVLARTMGSKGRANETGRGAAVVGAASGLAAGIQAEREVVRRCLEGRGHRVLR